MGVATDERRALCELFEQLGPDAPTLCEGWRTRDLAAHLVVREHRPDAAAGILVPMLASHTDSVQHRYAAQPWDQLVERVRSGPAWFWPTRLPPLDELVNSAEFLVHHEDARRGQEGWEPRPADSARDAAAWRSVKAIAKLTLRNSPVGVVLRSPGHGELSAKTGPDAVTLTGAPVEILLFAFGRDAVRLDFEGTPEAIDRLKALSRGL
ncbi:TIGR03085 family metal-binding protein [Amycolatopsis albispora]|uniref:TIGR03085 family protein n=1 Tax=Amycolatopsis albispora TaxID=1804986 RepID=A0A344KZD3_9PSEU|nr:TIGR03085 family metal-binding protein [Amycolatopsis albispora]AXB41157.1 TIGR03085 family protein [Amycolatopsis albispora]